MDLLEIEEQIGYDIGSHYLKLFLKDDLEFEPNIQNLGLKIILLLHFEKQNKMLSNNKQFIEQCKLRSTTKVFDELSSHSSMYEMMILGATQIIRLAANS